MLTRRSVLKAVAGGGTFAAAPKFASAQSLCSVWDKTLLWDFRHALWGAAPGDQKIVYLIGAPWCPFSKQAVKEHLTEGLPFELRFVPIDAVQASHRVQQADIVLNKVDGLRRTFLEARPKVPAIDPELVKLIHDANFVAQHGFQQRFSDLKSPTFIYETPRGAASAAGYKPWSEMASDLAPLGHETTDFANQLEAVRAATRKLAQPVTMKTMYRTAVHSLPDAASPSAGCVSYTTFKAVAEIHHSATDWVKVEALESKDKEAIYGYVDRRDVAPA